MYATHARARMCVTYRKPAPIALLPYPFRDENIITSQSMTQLHTFRVQSRRHGTRIFHHVGTRPYQRLHGTATTLSVWRCACVHCGTPFHIKTPANARTSKAFGVVHCLVHRRSVTKAGGGRGAPDARPGPYII